MDLLRIDADDGIHYIKASDLCLICPCDDTPTKSFVMIDIGGKIMKLTVPGDVDEVAAMFESTYLPCRIHRIN